MVEHWNRFNDLNRIFLILFIHQYTDKKSDHCDASVTICNIYDFFINLVFQFLLDFKRYSEIITL